MTVLEGAEPFSHATGGPVGVLLCHGFTGSPHSMKPLARHLAQHGYSVDVPLLPGHGTNWRELNKSRWPEWYATVDVALTRLRASCNRVVVAGLSMGGALSLRLAEQRPDDVTGLILVNPAVKLEDPRLRAVPVARHLVPSLPGIGSDIKKPGSTEVAYDRTPLHALHSLLDLFTHVRADLPRVNQPTLLIRSKVDHVVPASSSAYIIDHISSVDVTQVLLEDSYHVATLDHDADLIEKLSLDFVRRIGDEVAHQDERSRQ